MDIELVYKKNGEEHFFSSTSICGVAAGHTDYHKALYKAKKQVAHLIKRRGLNETLGDFTIVGEGQPT